MKKINGIGVSDGVVVSKVLLIDENKMDLSKITVFDTEGEVKKYQTAIENTKQQLSDLYEETKNRINAETAEIFEAHKLIADDPEIKSKVNHIINSEQVCASYALHQVSEEFAEMFLSMGDDYFVERAADVRDVSKRIISDIQGIEVIDLSSITKEVIIVAHDLTPSETAQINPDFIKGFATNIGGKTSHSAIIARQMGIPAVCGLNDITEQVENDSVIVLDGTEGLVITDASKKIIDEYQEKIDIDKSEKLALQSFVDKDTVTLDGETFELYANISSSSQVNKILNNGAEGIGLFRTEFLYLDKDRLPTEDEQFNEYKTVLESMENKAVVIRTLDIGGDKQLEYLSLPEEMNPFLGKRAIRLCFEEIEIFKTQLRALLRASVYGNLKIMFPMISTIEEFRKAKDIFNEVKSELLSQGIPCSDQIEVGIMVEVPSVAISADIFAREVDFFSIGTNDLIQYTFAADRMNQDLNYLYQPLHPSILRLIDMVVKAANRNGKWVGMCGELPSDIESIPLLVALGVTELSMTSTNILKTRKLISRLDKSILDDLLIKAMNASSYEEVQSVIMEELEWKKLLK